MKFVDPNGEKFEIPNPFNDFYNITEDTMTLCMLYYEIQKNPNNKYLIREYNKLQQRLQEKTNKYMSYDLTLSAAVGVGTIGGIYIWETASTFILKQAIKLSIAPYLAVKDPKLQGIVGRMYKGFFKYLETGKIIGDGSTADALRYELATGEKVFGATHLQKAQDLINSLSNWLKANSVTALQSDVDAARAMLGNLVSAIKGN
jgi:hypothetical protein